MDQSQKDVDSFIQRVTIDINSENALLEYRLSKQEDQQIKKYPEWNVARACPSFTLIEERLQLIKTKKILENKRINDRQRREEMDEQWESIRNDELSLRTSFIKFNKFIKENMEKRNRAQYRIKEERERQTTSQKKLVELTEKYERMQSIVKRMKLYVDKYKLYQAYLEKVVKETGEFQSINELFNRYDTLIDARMALAAYQDEYLQALETMGLEMYNMSETKSQALMRLNNQLSMLQRRHERAKALALKWENIVSNMKRSASEKNLMHTQARMCCWNIYLQICKRKGLPLKIERDDIEQQLIQIKQVVLELKRIWQIAEEKFAEAEKNKMKSKHCVKDK